MRMSFVVASGAWIGSSLLLLVACGGDPGGKPEDPRAGEVRAVVERLLAASRDGRALEVVGEVCTAALAEEVRGRDRARAESHAFEHEWKDVKLHGDLAVARVLLRYPDLDSPNRQFVMTYELVRESGGWKVSRFSLGAWWGEEEEW